MKDKFILDACCDGRMMWFNKSSEDLNYDDEIIHNPKKCSGCGMCEKVCPERMIKIKEERK